ncbi:MAG: T9SS type A sorting domain-containing protein [Ignavibacteriales bacterium]|nr:T9SS type A sorting domain-containing protein [Ignavibacteriales bacterium]
MKKLGILFVVVLMCAGGASAQLLTEDFDFSGNLTDNGWERHSGTTDIIATTTGLTYSGYANSGVGQSANVIGASEDVSKTFTRQTGDGLTLYLSALLQVTDAANSLAGSYFLHLGNRIDGGATTALETQFCARVFAKVDASGNVQIGASNTSTATYSSTNYAKNTTYLVIVKYVLFTGTDSVKMWVKSSGVPSNEGDAGTPDVQLAIDSATDSVNCVAIRQATGIPDFNIDGIRVATEWANAPLPVELTSFAAVAKGRGVELAWRTATEVNNHGFEIQRSEVRGQKSDVRGQWTKIGFVDGAGNSNATKEYSYRDNVPVSGKYLYRLKQVDNDGKFEYSSSVEVNASTLASGYELAQNHPNPFNPSLKVYDMLGKEIATLVNGKQTAGAYSVPFDASSYPSGIYFYTLRAGNCIETKKMLLVK